ncbi:MAG TPA: hypothetical protein VMV18_00675 [bacterium]|nr:hypothetical protein [bacterium]
MNETQETQKRVIPRIDAHLCVLEKDRAVLSYERSARLPLPKLGTQVEYHSIDRIFDLEVVDSLPYRLNYSRRGRRDFPRFRQLVKILGVRDVRPAVAPAAAPATASVEVRP